MCITSHHKDYHDTDYYNNGIKFARLLKSFNSDFVIVADNYQFTAHEFTEGDTFKVVTMPIGF